MLCKNSVNCQYLYLFFTNMTCILKRALFTGSNLWYSKASINNKNNTPNKWHGFVKKTWYNIHKKLCMKSIKQDLVTESLWKLTFFTSDKRNSVSKIGTTCTIKINKTCQTVQTCEHHPYRPVYRQREVKKPL